MSGAGAYSNHQKQQPEATMNDNLPSSLAAALVTAANTCYKQGDHAGAKTKLTEAFALKDEVERYNGYHWQHVHNAFTAAMLDMAELWYRLGDTETGDRMMARGRAWAWDPNCSSIPNIEREALLQKQKRALQRSGKLKQLWRKLNLRSLLPV